MHLEAIRAGTGRGVLPYYVGDGHPLLERLTPPIPEIAAEYWIIVHLDLRRSPNILIAEGTPAAWQAERAEFGIPSNFSLFAAALHLAHPDVRCAVLNIADGESSPRGTTLADFDGVMFPGSPLHIYDRTPSVTRQIDFARAAFAAGVPVWGSCWGLQLATVALVGSVRRNPRGRELAIAGDHRHRGRSNSPAPGLTPVRV
jgi:hypothetical protein